MRLRTLLFAAVLAYGGWHYWHTRPVQPPPGAGALAPGVPVQHDMRGEVRDFGLSGYRLTPLAAYDVTARVLSVASYHFGREADLSPLDFALGWGPMSDDAVLQHITIRQGGRFYYWNVRAFPIPRVDIETHSANTHLIPADDNIRDTLEDVRPGQVVRLRGYLVEVHGPDGWRWKSSLTRGDTGQGACELLWVEEARLL